METQPVPDSTQPRSPRLPVVQPRMVGLDPAAARALVRAEATWAVVGAATAGAMSLGTLAGYDIGPTTPTFWGVVAALGAVAARPPRIYLLPFAFLFVVGATIMLSALGVAPAVASALAAGVIVGLPGWQRTFESAAAGALGAALAWALASEIGAAGSALAVGALVAIGASLALVPAALRFPESKRRVRMPGDDLIKVSLTEPYRGPVLTAGRLEHHLSIQAPDATTRDGLTEVAHWVWQLGLTLQALDKDIATISPEDVAARRDALLVTDAVAGVCPAPGLAPGVSDDPFVRERQRGTILHLDKLLEHRGVLLRERARAESLQTYALAYLEEARAGLAVARMLPGEHTPEALGSVLERLREHAADRSSRRNAAREVGVALP